MERTSEWIFSLDIPSDVTVHAAGVPFSLHKTVDLILTVVVLLSVTVSLVIGIVMQFPLILKSGYIRQAMSESRVAEKTVLVLPDVTGGSDGFELAAKFCYGIHFDVTAENAATLRCVAEYLEMTEKYAASNLVQRSETYINEVALKTLPAAIAVLHNCESFLSIAEEVKLVSRCIEAIASLACKESQGQVAAAPASRSLLNDQHVVERWSEELTSLGIDLFQRVLVAMMSRGFEEAALGSILTLYAQKSLCCMDTYGTGARKIEAQLAQEKRVVVETLTGLLPRESHALSASFISVLLRASILVETSKACRVNLERRMGSQLRCAVLDDILIPTYSSSTEDALFDVDTLHRIVSYHLEFELLGSCGDRESVGKLLESCIAEIASDPNLSVAKFVTLAEVIPDHYKVTEDGVYRAVDIYLKAHPNLSDLERKKVCAVMNCQRLSKEACVYAVQNEHLPVYTAVQVLFYEQQRLQAVISESLMPVEKLCSCSTDNLPAALEMASLQGENEALKLKNLKLKKKLEDMEKREIVRFSGSGSDLSPARNSTTQSSDKPGSLRRKSFINSMSKRLGWFYLFPPIGPAQGSAGTTPANPEACTRPRGHRRHSVS